MAKPTPLRNPGIRGKKAITTGSQQTRKGSETHHTTSWEQKQAMDLELRGQPSYSLSPRDVCGTLSPIQSLD